MKKIVLHTWLNNIWEEVFPETYAKFVKRDNGNPDVETSLTNIESDLFTKSEEIQNLNTNKLNIKPNGIDLLIVDGKLTATYIPDVILGQLQYGGAFSSSDIVTGSPYAELVGVNLSAISPERISGFYFLYQGPDTYHIFKGYEYNVGDWAVCNGAVLGSEWSKIDNTDAITGIKGNAETVYRKGQVNLTAANIGAVDKNGDTMTGPLILSSGQSARGYKTLANTGIVGIPSEEQSGFYTSAWTSYDKHIVVGDSEDKLVIGWDFGQGSLSSGLYIRKMQSGTYSLTRRLMNNSGDLLDEYGAKVYSPNNPPETQVTPTGTYPNMTVGNATKVGTVTVGTSAKPIYLSAGVPTECTRIIPQVTLNGNSTTTPSFYAPTDFGTAGTILVSQGTSAAPVWKSKPTYFLNTETNVYNVADYIVRVYRTSDGSFWYRIWNSGWKECGGIVPASTSDIAYEFPASFSFANSAYTVVGSFTNTKSSAPTDTINLRNCTFWNRTPTGFKCRTGNDTVNVTFRCEGL